MATFPALWSSDNNHAFYTYAGLFTKFPSYPDVDVPLLDLDGGTSGFQRIVLTSGGVIYTEGEYRGAYCRANLTPHLRLLADRWYWVVIAMGCTDGSFTGTPTPATSFGLVGQCFDFNGSSDGAQGVWAAPGAHSDTVNCKAAFGVSLNAQYGNQKNEAGRLIAQPRIGQASGRVDGYGSGQIPPTADLDPANIDGAYYPCNQPVGAANGLTAYDATNLHLDMDSGPNGLFIVRDSPY